MEHGSCHDHFLHSEPDISNTESNFVKYKYSLSSLLFWFGIWRSAYLVHSEAHDTPLSLILFYPIRINLGPSLVITSTVRLAYTACREASGPVFFFHLFLCYR